LLADPAEVQRITPLTRPAGFFKIFWQPSALERVAAEVGVAAPLHWQLTTLAAGPASSELLRLHQLLESGADARSVGEAYQSATLALLLAASQSAELAASRARCHPRARRAAERLRSSFAEALSIADLSSGVQLSKYHLVRCFQHSLGVPPHRYRKLLRLQRARRLLERGLSVVDAANETGFSDASHLTRAFREWLGISPAAWRSAWRASDPSNGQRPRTTPPPRSP
jgi:AraC-like DNA-binding protein